MFDCLLLLRICQRDRRSGVDSERALSRVAAKIKERCPHVFGNENASTAEEAHALWKRAKEQQKLAKLALKRHKGGHSPSFASAESSQSPAKLLSKAEFHQQNIDSNTPAIFKQSINAWPAFSLWQNALNLKRNCFNEELRVDVSCSTTDTYSGHAAKDQRVSVKFTDFVDYVDAYSHGKSHYYGDMGMNFYLCQLRIIEPGVDPVLSFLNQDIEVPSLIDSSSVMEGNLWVCSRPSCSTLHYDANHNLLCVVR